MNRGDIMDKEKIKSITLDITGDVKKVKNAISQLETDMAIVQTGDANGAYWNGANAYSFVKNCLSQIDHDNQLLKSFDQCINYLNSLIK
jgi:hypothetical protein